MKKNIVYLAIAVVLASIVGYLAWHDSQKNKPANDQDFNVANIEEIERIFIAGKDGRTIKLDKKDGYWMANDTFKAMQAKVDFLLSTLKSFVIYSPVPEAAWDNAIKELATQAIKVELYDDADDAPFKVYYVGKPNQGQTANYMLMQLDGQSAKRPYLVHIPGFIGDLQTRYLLNLSDWRDLTVFNYKLDEIAEISYTYHEVPQASFIITAQGNDGFTLKHPNSPTPEAQEKLFVAGINKFLDSFVNLNAESVENEFVYKDSVLAGPKLATITIKAKSGESSELVMYRMPANRRTKMLFDQFGNAIPFDPDHYYAVFNNGKDFGIVQHYVFGKVLRKYDDFVLKQKDDKAPL